MKPRQQHIKTLLSTALDASALANLKGGNQPIGSHPYDLVTPGVVSRPYTGQQVDEIPD